MIREVDLSRNSIAAAARAQKALGFLRETPEEKVLITASNGQVAIDSELLKLALNLLRQVAQPEVEDDPGDEVSPQEAATLLKMSRPTVMRLLRSGQLPSRLVGSHYRLPRADVLRYKAQNGANRRQSLDDMAAFSQDFDV